jgi:hypothetical protein
MWKMYMLTRIVPGFVIGLCLYAMLPAWPAQARRPSPEVVTRAFIEQQFVAFDPDYLVKRAKRFDELKPLEARLFDLQKQGQFLPCSAHILNETRWILNSTADFSRADKNIWILKLSLDHPDQDFALAQMGHDGSWGLCYDEWFKKLDPMITALNEMARDNRPPDQKHLAFLARINSPEKMVTYLESLRVSDIPRTGVNQRDELGAVTAILAEVFYKPSLRDYVTRYLTRGRKLDEFVGAFTDFLTDWQDPDTGFWGPWYRSGFRVLKARDLSFTYHIVAYRKGDVPRWDRILDTLVAIQEKEYPFGWLQKGRLTNHHAYDVARIIKLGWPHFGEAQREKARIALNGLLDFARTETLDEDGSVTPRAGFSSGLDDAYYYAASFLNVIGYCSREPAFWTKDTWPEAFPRCCALSRRLSEIASQAVTPRLRAAEARLSDHPSCEMERDGPELDEIIRNWGSAEIVLPEPKP